MKTVFLTLALGLGMSLFLNAQDERVTDVILAIAEDLAAGESDPEAISVYIDRLHDLAEEPVNLNSADEEELSRLFFLSPFQIKALADYVHSTGIIYSPYEIASIPGFDRGTAEMLVPFVSIETPAALKATAKRPRSTLLSNFSYKPANKDTTFLGSPVKLLAKYKYDSENIITGLTVEKDPGEKIFYGNPPLPDFASGYLAWKGKGVIRKLIIGDYSASFGQGTNINTSMQTGVALTLQDYSPGRNELKEYTSSDENNFFRGIAAALTYKNLSATVFYSVNKIDASTSLGYITSFYSSGLHTTPGALVKKDAATNFTTGASILYNYKWLKAGASWSTDRLSMPVEKSLKPEDIHDFSGDRSSVYSVYYNSVFNRILLYGEASVNLEMKHAIVQGLGIKASDRLSVNAVFKDYQPGYYSFHGKGPGGSSSAWNQRSITGSFSFEAAKHLFLNAGAELIHYPWLKYRVSSPSSGVRDEVRLIFEPSTRLALEAMYQYRESILDSAETIGVPGQNEIKSNYFRTSVKYSLTENFRLSLRADYKTVSGGGGNGILIYQDISFKPKSLPLTLWVRYCLFKTSSWSARIYTYENDLLYSFSIPALSGEGSRSYILVKWDIGKNIDLRLRYAVTTLKKEADFQRNDEFKGQLSLRF